jgi:hypothetical protein
MKDSIRLVDIAFFVENRLALVTRFFPLSILICKEFLFFLKTTILLAVKLGVGSNQNVLN